VRAYQQFTFEQRGELVHLVKVETSASFDPGLERNIDELIVAPNSLHSTPVDRCLAPGATGYRFVPRR
jgi:hypothetical protein